MISTPRPSSGASLVECIARTAMRYSYRAWGFGESIAMEGLLRAGEVPAAVAFRLLRGWAHDSPPLAGDPLAHVAPGVPLLALYSRSREQRLLERACELAEVLDHATAGRHGARLHRPDLPGWESEVWVDCMHLDGPFLVALGRELRDTRWADLGVDLLLSHARVLQDERSGLFSHGFDDVSGLRNGVHWARGQGWALLGLVDTLAEARSHRRADEIHQRLHALVSGLAATEATAGSWHTVVDHPETYIEASASAFVALGVGRAARHALVDPAFRGLARRAWLATRTRLSDVGELAGVSDATPVGTSVEHYARRATGIFPWGQGPAMLAAQEMVLEEGME